MVWGSSSMLMTISISAYKPQGKVTARPAVSGYCATFRLASWKWLVKRGTSCRKVPESSLIPAHRRTAVWRGRCSRDQKSPANTHRKDGTGDLASPFVVQAVAGSNPVVHPSLEVPAKRQLRVSVQSPRRG